MSVKSFISWRLVLLHFRACSRGVKVLNILVIVVKIRLRLLISIFLMSVFVNSYAEPFIKTDDMWLRADIETLANVGIIRSPITTWPLTWGPILKDLKNVKLNEVPERYRSVLLRVLREGRRSTGRDSFLTEFRMHAGQESQLFRYFGDKARDKRELSTRTAGMTSNFAWNLEVTLAPDSVDGDDKRFDGSYISAIGGNWIFAVGQMEQWWGPGFQHSLILSNNAKPVPAIYLKRNYAESFETPLLNWIGPWTFNVFAGQLDDARTINNAKLLGMSVAFKPIDSLEIGLRRTAQWGGDGRPENFDSFLDMLTGLDNCDEGGNTCDDRATEPGNQLAGIDLTWRPHLSIPSSFYLQTVGEDEAGYAPSKKSWLYGVNFQLSVGGNPLSVNLEYTDTSVDGDGNIPGEEFSGYNVLYEHSLYRHGYRYRGRSIGSTIDNDSKMTSLLMTYQTNDWGQFSLLSSQVDLNVDGEDVPLPGGHSIQQTYADFNEFIFKWMYPVRSIGKVLFKLTKRSESLINNSFEHFEKDSFAISWSIDF
ncbi:capsule assembly Wzi family protein [Pleionea sediminis]|uniref:capsule assembly Wzi family protein n=1 Tax=Pleionea sediminis TaxID=2569479 RepID=UPI001FE584A9|nr:capsule assembly Wzi family protein [Pleionea sediminis]